MSLRVIEITAASNYADGIAKIAEEFEVLDYHPGAEGADGRRVHTLVVGQQDRQGLLDALQSLLGEGEESRVVVISADATLPAEHEEEEEDEEQDENGDGEQDEESEEEKKRRAVDATREELYIQVAHGADLQRSYLLLTLLSTIVAAIGLIENNVAVIIGAMVIAPLLGPNLAFSFGVALGDSKLMLRALRTGMAGIGVAAAVSIVIGASHLLTLDAPELLSRTRVGLDGIVLALASGAAAVLSITTGLPMTMVGVMVAVALLPPLATAGLMFGAGHTSLAVGALLLLVVNIVSVNLAALVVFLVFGIKPRTWLEQRAARQSSQITVIMWAVMLAILAAVIYLRQPT